MKVLIIYGSTEGQTRKICHFLSDEAKNLQHEVLLDDATSGPTTPAGFDAVIIGASVHGGKYQTAVEHYVQTHCETLNRMRSIFISVSLTAASSDRESWQELEKTTSNFLEKTGWKPSHVEQVAGALRYSQYDFFKKFIMRLIAKHEGGDTDTSHDYEYTDWSRVKGILKQLPSPETAGNKE